MTNLVWLNIPLCAIAFIATVGVPLRLVFTDPARTGPARNPRNAQHSGKNLSGRRRDGYCELAA